MESAIYCGMESDQRSEWNRGNAVYGIKPQEIYSIRASRNAMRDFIAIPYNARGALIPYQACGMDKKEATFGRQKLLLFWRRRRDSNSRTAFDGYTISNRARSTSYATSPCMFGFKI